MFNLRPIPLGSIPEIEPVFVVGAARSGTTPLQLALNMHPDLGVYGETQAFFVRRMFGAETNAASFRRLLNYWRVVVSGCSPYSDLFDHTDIQRELGRATNYADVVNLVMSAIAAREGKSRWGEKSPAHIFRLAEIRTCFPNARVIHIIRDPRAVICSSIKAFRNSEFNDWNIYSGAKYWVRCVNVHARQVASKADKYTIVRYEDLVTQPELTLRSLCSFLGITFAEDMLNAHQVASQYVRPGKSGQVPPLHALTQKPLDATRVDGWKTMLSPAHLKLIEQVAGKHMVSVGYTPRDRRYVAPKMIALSHLSTRWTFWESRRITTNKIQAPYWALRRAFDAGRKRSFRQPETAS